MTSTARPRESLTRVRLWPTAAGTFYLVITLTITLGGINYNSALACGLGYLLAALALVSAVHAWRNLAELELRGIWAEPVFAGEPLQFRLSFDHAGPERIALRLDPIPQRGRHKRRIAGTGAPFNLPAGGGVAEILVPTTTRGWKRCPRLRLESIFPLGLFRSAVEIDADANGLVYPAPDGQLPLPAPHGPDATGQHAAGPGTDDFAGLRDYHPGDPPRAIAWRTFAQSDRLAVKRFVSGAADHLTLHWDHVARLPAIEAGLSQLCRWLLEAERLQLAIGLDLPGVRLAPERGSAQMSACLRALAEFGA